MTTPRYPSGCSARSQARGDAWSSDYAWIVNFNNGNANNDHRDNNNGFVRAVRSVPAGECQGEESASVSLRALHDAWREARRGKKPSGSQLEFEVRWADQLLELQRRLVAGTWTPSRSTCFIATRPKAREIHAPAFADRVVHHWLVPQLEAIYERGFIHDSYANRRGKGTHAAVRRLEAFVRQVASGQGGGYFLQLDIHNFFNQIHRPTLWAMLKARMGRAQLPAAVQQATHALIRRSPIDSGVRYLATADEIARVPAHKRLANAPAGCGVPIGNLSSQFFANVYLDVLDQFVKHELKAPRYLRYVDDFVLVHRDREQLLAWRDRIAAFLGQKLRLSLKDDEKLRPLGDGIDFLGYVVRPTHTTVRRRVVAHAREALATWEREHVLPGGVLATPAELRGVASVWGSHRGHLEHAASWRLRQGLARRFPWLASATRRRRFAPALEGRRIRILLPRATP